MKDFAAQYKTPVYFGIWAEDDIPQLAKRDAWNVIKNSSARTRNHDVRSPELFEALDYLESKAIRTAPYRDFRKSLEVHDPDERYRLMGDALQRIWKGL